METDPKVEANYKRLRLRHTTVFVVISV